MNHIICKTGIHRDESSSETGGIIVAFRRHTLLPLDDCLSALQPTLPHLTRSSLHRCLQRHGISRLPDVAEDKPEKKKFKTDPIGSFYIDSAEVQTAEGKLYLSVASDRTSTFTVVQVASKTGRTSASAFLSALIEAVPDTIHTVLTDNGIPFTFPARYADGPTARHMTPMVDRRCQENGIEHRLTKVKHPWTNGQVDRMNRTIKDAIVTRFHDDDHASSKRTSPTSSQPTPSAEDGRPCAASPHTKTSAKSGLQSQNDSDSTQSIKCRDQTPKESLSPPTANPLSHMQVPCWVLASTSDDD